MYDVSGGQIITERVFCREDIEAAIGNCNFNKAIGVDWFSGKVMKRNNDIKMKLIDVMLKWLNDYCIPDYILVGKAVLFSKTWKRDGWNQ